VQNVFAPIAAGKIRSLQSFLKVRCKDHSFVVGTAHCRVRIGVVLDELVMLFPPGRAPSRSYSSLFFVLLLIEAPNNCRIVEERDDAAVLKENDADRKCFEIALAFVFLLDGVWIGPDQTSNSPGPSRFGIESIVFSGPNNYACQQPDE